MGKPVILFRWSDSGRALQDDRTLAARIIRAHRKARARGEQVLVIYDRNTHRIEVGHRRAGVTGIWTRL